MTVDELLRENKIVLPSTAPGRYYTTCPRCSASRRKSANKCLGVTIDDDGAHWGCSHCDWTGGSKANGAARAGHSQPSIVATYDYTDESGTLLSQVCRRSDKQFPQRRPDGKGGWTWGTAGVRKVPYRLPELLEAVAAEHTIIIVEGEKDVENLLRIGIPATCNPGGASKPNQKPKWRPEYSDALIGADVIIIPDNDDQGRAHAEAIARDCAGKARRILVLDLALHWPECPKGGDISDWLDAGHTREELDALIDQVRSAQSLRRIEDQASVVPHSAIAAHPQPKSLSAEVLANMTFAPIKYVVPGVIVEGLTLLAAKPKLGKSWLMLHAAIAVARGGFTLGDLHCIEGDVLYCALEDNLRRLQSRMTKLMGLQPWPKRLHFVCEMPPLALGGLASIREWIAGADHPRLIIIDTLAMVRPQKKANETHYDADYAAVKELRQLANEHGIAIVLVHHLRKAESDDAFDTVSGTLGLTGAVDTVLVLKRDNGGNVVLHGRGRDLIEIEKVATFNAETCLWTIAGDARVVRNSNERRTILAALEETSAPMTPKQIADAGQLSVGSVKHLLAKMAGDGLVKKEGYGKYVKADQMVQ